MRHILLINPNSSELTTSMMVRIAADALPDGFQVRGATARRGPSMIVNAAELNAAGLEVEQAWHEAGTTWDGVIVSAFGDPGIERLRQVCDVPVTGICEASMLEAAQDARRFGVATVTPDLVDAIDGRAAALGLSACYTGTRLTCGDPRALTADSAALEAALASTVLQCIEIDGAQAVIIGGGPLGQAAIGLTGRFGVPVIAPISAAVRRLLSHLPKNPCAVSTSSGIA